MENGREQARAYVMNEKHTDIVICIDQGAEVPTINAVKEMIKDFCLKYKEASTLCDPMNHNTPCPSPSPRVYPNSCPLSQ